MAPARPAVESRACRKLPPIALAFRSKFLREESLAGQDRAFHPVDSGQIRRFAGARIERNEDDLVTFKGADPCAGLYLILGRPWLAGSAIATTVDRWLPPVKIAVFPFELEDFSAAAPYVPPDDIDREQLRLSTKRPGG